MSRSRTVAIIQARMDSVRLPGKVLLKVLGKPVLEHICDRLKKSENLDLIVIVTPDSDSNIPIGQLGDRLGIAVIPGSERDVLTRYTRAAHQFGAEIVVRITADCPFVDPRVVDDLVEEIKSGRADFAVTSPAFPEGFDAEAFTLQALVEADFSTDLIEEREHVTTWMNKSKSIRKVILEPSRALPMLRVTIDEPEDFEVVDRVARHFGNLNFSYAQVMDLWDEQPDVFMSNIGIERNEGAKLSSGQKLWKRAQRSIAGGNMLLSKRPELHAPEKWPTYFSRAKGCSVWDLDGREFIDMGLMGVGTNILGYGHTAVDEAVRGAVARGNLSTLNAPEEVALAEKLLELHTWADKVRFARSGGEAVSIAVRLARAATGRDRVVFCGYHGWHDWYLAANLINGGALDSHLIPGLQPSGVPRALEGSSAPFFYNDALSFDSVFRGGLDVAAVVMEVQRSEPPDEGFLEYIRAETARAGVALVFDECSSGFREVVGGQHLVVDVLPDVAVFGKTLGNGYAITSVIGRAQLMDAIDSTFVSSTFWTERIGPVAGLTALRQMEIEDAPARVKVAGERMRGIWRTALGGAGLTPSMTGLSAISTVSVGEVGPRAFKTLMTDYFLEKGFLAGPTFYASIAHEDHNFDLYEELFDEFSRLLSDQVREGEVPSEKDESLCWTGFSRLN